MTSTQTSDLTARARALTEGATRSGDIWGYFEHNSLYRDYLQQLEDTDDVSAFHDFVLRPDDFEPQHVLFPTLKRLASLAEPNPYLYLLIHRLAEWAGTAGVDEKYDWVERAAKLGPEDRHVLWDLFFARGDDRPERRAEVLDRIERTHPEDGSLVGMVRAAMTTRQTEPLNVVWNETRNRPLPADAILRSLQPRGRG
jgi:hypothetical protein